MYDGWQWDHPRGAYWTNHDCPGDRRIKPGGYLFGRWLWVREHILKPNDLERLPIALTEFGIDHVVFSDRIVGHPIAGWQSAREWWARMPQPANPDDPRHNWRPRPDGGQYLMQQMAWADDVMRSDPYMLGATFFKVGMPAEWHTFNAGPELENLMLAHMRRLRDEPALVGSQPEPVPAPAPSPAPAPRPTPSGDVGIPNPRPYVLLPPTGAPGEWLRAVSQTALAQAGCTFGFSPDEAIRGAPDRRIYILNPGAWDQSVLRYIDQHYPDLQISSVLVNTPSELRQLTGLGSDLL
jgi:hypothetical protein